MSAGDSLSVAVKSVRSVVLLFLGALLLIGIGVVIGAVLVSWPIFWGIAFTLALVAVVARNE